MINESETLRLRELQGEGVRVRGVGAEQHLGVVVSKKMSEEGVIPGYKADSDLTQKFPNGNRRPLI